ncbi:MAG: creatininase family protein [Planctomycetes bacterium]|nr:creatininase family protein [Planctomycetota bacterium]
MPPSYCLTHLGSAAVREHLQRPGGDVVMVPVGSCERHGNPFTPLGLDALVTLALVERAAARAQVLYTPLVPFGYTPHHMGAVGEGAGTVCLSAETYRRLLEDVGRSLIYHGFNKIVYVSEHTFNAEAAQDVLFSLRFRTGAIAAFYSGRECPQVAQILGSPPERLASDLEASLALALLPEGSFELEPYLRHGYQVHAPAWLGPAFRKRAGTGLRVAYQGAENITLGMDDRDFVSPILRPAGPEEQAEERASADKGRRILDATATHLAAFAESFKPLKVSVSNRDFPERAR